MLSSRRPPRQLAGHRASKAVFKRYASTNIAFSLRSEFQDRNSRKGQFKTVNRPTARLAVATRLRAGFLPFEKALMAVAFLLPLISRVLAGAVGLPLAPLTIAALFALTMRRALKPAANGEPRVTLDTKMEIGLSLAPER